MSDKTPTSLGIDKKRKEESSKLSKEFKKPKTKQSSLLSFSQKQPSDSLKGEILLAPPVKKEQCLGTTDVQLGRVIAMLEVLTGRQDRVLECTERLVALCLQEGPEDSSEEVTVDLSKGR